jgi:hypothetical protein
VVAFILQPHARPPARLPAQVRRIVGAAPPRPRQRFFPQCQRCSIRQATALRNNARVLVLHLQAPHYRSEHLAGARGPGRGPRVCGGRGGGEEWSASLRRHPTPPHPIPSHPIPPHPPNPTPGIFVGMRRNVRPLPPPADDGGDGRGGATRSRVPRILNVTPLALTAEAEAPAVAASVASPAWAKAALRGGETGFCVVEEEDDACRGMPSVVDGRGRGGARQQHREAAAFREARDAWYVPPAVGAAASLAAAAAAATAAAPRPGAHLLPGRTSSLAGRRSDSMGGPAPGMLGGLGGGGGGGMLFMQPQGEADVDVAGGAEAAEQRPAARAAAAPAPQPAAARAVPQTARIGGNSSTSSSGSAGSSSGTTAEQARPAAPAPAGRAAAPPPRAPTPDLSASFQQWVPPAPATGAARRAGATAAMAPAKSAPPAVRGAHGYGAAAALPARARESDDALAESDAGSPLRPGRRNPSQQVRGRAPPGRAYALMCVQGSGGREGA